jgi:hypothetical protein
MIDWCTYFQEYGSSFYCEKTNKEPSYDTIKYNCKNGGYGCSHYWVSTITGVILKKKFNDKVLLDIINLRKDIQQHDRYDEYVNYIKMYDAVGPILVDRINMDKDSYITASKIYSIMTRISTFVDKGEKDRAITYYSKMVLALVNKYNLNNLYNTQADFWNKANKDAKKVQKLTKTIEK